MDDQVPELTLSKAHEHPPASVPPASPSAGYAAISDAPAAAVPGSAELSAIPAKDSGAKRGLLARAMGGVIAPMIAIVAWFVPGLGHLLLRRWQRALAFFVAVGGLAVTGYLMRGNAFALHSPDPFGTLGFLADASSGVFYLLAHVLERSGPDVARAMGDYGTRFIAGAGIVNMLGVCDAYEVARGRKY
jgi:hypothetical protein